MPAFDWAGEIFIAYLGNRACDLGFRALGQFDDGQAGGRGHEAEQAERVFQRGRTLLREDGRQRCQPVLQIPRGLRTPHPRVRKDRLAQLRCDVGDDGNAAIAAIGDKGQRRCVVSGQQSETCGQL